MKTKSIKFEVPGKPPKKSKWSSENNIKSLISLRNEALSARNKAGYRQHFTTPIKLKLTVYAPNIMELTYKQKGDHDEKRPVGDLDALIAGVCDGLWAGPTPGVNKFEPSKLFDENPKTRPGMPILVQDDSQIVNILAKKKVSKMLRYVVEVIPLN